jgi:glycosyltransferase involved in cell wall biosynthesis
VRELAGKSGTLVPAKNADALSSAMVDLMGKAQADREALGREARLRIENKFSMENKAAEWEALYRALLERRD